MSCLLSLFLISLSLELVLCEKCSEALHKTFKKGLNLSDKCDACKVLSPWIFFLGKNWTGFCWRNEFFLFEDWKYKEENELKGSEPFVLVSQELCESFEGNYYLDMQCLRQFNAEMGEKKTVFTGTTLTKNAISDSSKKATKASLTTQKICEPTEFFYDDYCYFVKHYGYSFKDIENVLNSNSNKSTLIKVLNNSIESCQERHPDALGLAVETEAENEVILQNLKTVNLFHYNIILTSGVRINSSVGEWIGWNLKVNESIVKIYENPSINDFYSFYCINSSYGFWYLCNSHAPRVPKRTFFLICKRPYNPKQTMLELYELCQDMYRESPCYDIYKHKRYCCAKDDLGVIWFSCPNTTQSKRYKNGMECVWNCQNNGLFINDRPTCKGSPSCSATYSNHRYTAPVQRYALGNCPKFFSGYSTWFCGSNKKFLGTPDYSLCCALNVSKCSGVDRFLNVWKGCAFKTSVKKLSCPPDSYYKEALVEWFCTENGTFSESEPDYSHCNITEIKCKKQDRFGFEWTAQPETTAVQNCPPSFTGNCFWKCQSSGTFDGPEPDCSKCKAEWMEEVENKIKNNSKHEEVMEIVEKYTKKEDLRIGFSHVISITSDCVTLYKMQNVDNKFPVFDKFLRSYSKILKNLAGDFSIWSSFSEANREEHVAQILKATHTAAFANLETMNTVKEQYNATFTTSAADGFDFFVAYNPPVGSNFPLENFSQSNCHLKINKFNENFANTAAMGLIMNYSLGSLMFPRGEKTKGLEINSPVVTFTVASVTNGEVVIEPNVSVVISFKHNNRTRFPPTEIIRRKLHSGEFPSGVYNSTLCYYYRNFDWTTEGCYVTYSSRDRTNCTCHHLSTIGLLMSIHKYEPNTVLEFVSSVSSGITIVSLILALYVFYFLDKGNNDRVLIGKNLCLCLLLGHIMLLAVMDKKFIYVTDTMCRVFAILLHYVFMAAFAWMFVEGYHLYRMLVIVFNSDIDYRWIYLLIGYGGPLVIVGATHIAGLISQEQPYGQDELCWLKTPNYVWAFIGPVIALTSINFCILIVAMKMAVSSKRQTEKSSSGTIKLWLKGWISLSALLGITWLFGLSYIHYNENFAYIFVVLNGLQGFFIFLFRCLLCEQYKTIILKKLKSWFWFSKSKTPKKSDFRSETKVYAISATKSSSGDIAKNSPGETTTDESSTTEKYNHGRKKLQNTFTPKIKPKQNKYNENFSGLDIDINVTLTPAMSEAYLRNRMISKNFSARKSKATLMADAENFPETFYKNIPSTN